MTEKEWKHCVEPRMLFKHLVESARTTERKHRLLACGWCRLTSWDLLTDERSKKAVEAAELYADGALTKRKLDSAREGAVKAATLVLKKGYSPKTYSAAANAANTADYIGHVGSPRGARQKGLQCTLIRDVYGPFVPVQFVPAWQTSTVIALAKELYDTRDFNVVAILADALQDASCENADILNHLRGPGPHVRGCWVIDLILGKA